VEGDRVDFTYVMTWSGVVYVVFIVDAFSRRIVGWKADTTMKTSLALDTLEIALWGRDRAGIPIPAGLVHHNDAGSQYTSFAFTSRLKEAGVDASVGSVGDAYLTLEEPSARGRLAGPRPIRKRIRGRRA
jgi:putative transposase